jgi:hypothetical protein
MRIVQLTDPHKNRKIALVNEPDLVFIETFDSVFTLVQAALTSGQSLVDLIEINRSQTSISYEEVYRGEGAWQLLPAIDHPADPRFCLVSGTGLTHKASASNRQKMHDAQTNGQQTDSMRIYEWGLAGGKPEPGQLGVQPEWFYKGNGSILKGHLQPLTIPEFGEDGGEEPELAAIYINDRTGTPYRIGFATGNEFSDHRMEKRNYLYLAPSKIRNCSLGPELVLTQELPDLSGRVAINREGELLWEKAINTGESHMAHNLRNLEHHHFKYPNHRIPNDVHIHFLGADAFSFGENINLKVGDEMVVEWFGMGRALKNILRSSPLAPQPYYVKYL